MFKNFEIIYKEINNKSFFYIAELGLVSSGNSIDNARKNLEIEYEKYQSKLKEAEIEVTKNSIKNDNNSTGSLSIKSNYLNEFSIFGGKLLIVLIVMAFCSLYIGSKIEKQLSQLKEDISLDELITKVETIPNKIIQSIENIQVGESPLKKIEKEIERAARVENMMPKEKKDEIIKNINTIVDRNKPFIDAIGRFFE